MLQCQHVEYGSHEDNRSLAGGKKWEGEGWEMAKRLGSN